jgi:hypothetical protein
MLTHFTKRIKAWAAVDLVQTALAGPDCTRAAFTMGLTRPSGDVAIPVEQRGTPVYRKWLGTLDRPVNAAVSARVTAYRHPQNYSQGWYMRNGPVQSQQTASQNSGPGALNPIGSGAPAGSLRAQSVKVLGHPPPRIALSGGKGTDAFSASPSAVGPFHAVGPGKYKLGLPKRQALAMQSSYAANHR